MAGALIGALRVSLSAETSAFEAGMKRSQRTAQTTASSIKNSFGSIRGEFGLLKAGLAGFVGALSVGTLIAAGKAALDYAGSLGEVAQSLGVTTRELQTFRYAVSQNGGTAEDADQALGKLAISISKAQSGSKQAAAAFGAVGVQLADLRTKSREEILGQIADQMKATGGAAANAAAGVAIFGRGFLKIAPTLDQGSAGLNNLSAAAQKLGIVLSDKQIAEADETADKLDALQTVLKAQIAGAVADNADAIIGLANAIAEVAREAANAIRWLKGFYIEAQKAAAAAEIGISNAIDKVTFGLLPGAGQRSKNRAAAQQKIDSLNRQQGESRFSGLFRGRPRATGGGGSLPQFLAGGGGGGGRKSRGRKDNSAEEAERKRLQALRDANEFDQDIRRAKIDVLRATQDLATDAVERYTISVQIKDAEKAAHDAELQYQVAAGEITQVQAAQLQAEYDKKDALERQKMIADEQARAYEESQRLDQVSFDLERDRLQSEAQLADTASEQRDIQLRLLDLYYRQERARLQAIIADEQSSEAAKEEARRRMANLNQTYGNDRAGVMAGTRSPLEEYAASLPLDADRMNEALENVAVHGLQHLEDGLVAVAMGTKKLGQAFKEMAQQIIEELIRIAIQKYIIGTIGSVLGFPGFSGGGEVGAPPSFAVGGWTGHGGKYEPAGIVHRKEFVFDAEATHRLGVPFLEALRKGKAPGMATGGLVSGISLPRVSMASRARLANDNGVPPSDRNRPYFDLRGAVMTEDLLRQMNEIGARAADAGGDLGVKRMRDLNQRSFGRAAR